MNRLDVNGGRAVPAKKNPLKAAWSVGRDMANFAACALAGNPPQLSVIVMSAALGFLLGLLPTRPAWRLRLD